MSRRWTVELPAGVGLPSANVRSNHWGPRHRADKQIKGDVITLCRAARIPRMDDPVAIVAEYRPPPEYRGRIVRDTHNLAPAVKPAIDGLKAAGVLIDDNDSRVTSVTFRPGPTVRFGQLALHIEPPAGHQAAEEPGELGRLRGIAADVAALIAGVPGGPDALDYTDAEIRVSAVLLRALRDSLPDPADENGANA